LKIFGDGLDLPRLHKLAGDAVNIEFLGRVSEEKKSDLYAHALAFINPQEEDFGITAVEAMASGRPVLAYQRGGATETIIENVSGLFFKEQTAAAIMKTVRQFINGIDHEGKTWDSQTIKNNSDKYSVENFKKQITALIEDKKKDLEI